MDIITLDGFQYAITATVDAKVTHNAPCTPECSECYPCKKCGILHALGLHEESRD